MVGREELEEFFSSQLKTWALAEKNYNDLAKVRQKKFKLRDLEGRIQFNPARAVSTLAKVDKDALKSRPCFLCSQNRPDQQLAVAILPGWELLVNPYPILPLHFTVASTSHTPQKFNFEDGIKIAKELPGMVVFFNADGAGASAPDHLHYQAVPLEALPLISLIDKNFEKLNSLAIPFKVMAGNRLPTDLSYNANSILNAFFWSKDNNEIRYVLIPRSQHRPKEYFLEPPLRRAVSPGAIDMAGVVVTPFEEDFNLMQSEDIFNIYRQVAYSLNN